MRIPDIGDGFVVVMDIDWGDVFYLALKYWPIVLYNIIAFAGYIIGLYYGIWASCIETIGQGILLSVLITLLYAVIAGIPTVIYYDERIRIEGRT